MTHADDQMEPYRQAVRAATALPASTDWTKIASDPNDAPALALRARDLAAAFRPPVPDRVNYLIEACRGRRVLDIGAVAHDAARMDRPDWLHRRLAAVAAECVAVDILPEGVQAMRDRGFEAIVHDLGGGLGPLADRGPFDVIVAGELIEHLDDQGMLFRVAREALAPGGRMILTTPNPYAPMRQWAGSRGVVWENADHVVLAFPSGIAALAQRHGLRLLEAMTVVPERRAPSLGERARRVKRRVTGTGFRVVGLSTASGDVHPTFLGVPRGGRSRPMFSGETFIYVVGHRATTSG